MAGSPGYDEVIAAALLLALASAAPDDSAEFAKKLEACIDPASLRQWHDLLGSEPHVAGTDGDAREIRRLDIAFKQMGLEVEVDEFWAYLASPVSARVEIVGPADTQPARRGVLPIIERNLAEDPAAAHPDLTWGWNAYSGSGEVESEVIYANYGTRADFARLKELGVSVTGKIVIARYGGNFRGYKARFAQDAGAAGLLMYIDPADSGFTKGAVYPQGTWANDTCIQRGAVGTLPYPGDPLTPMIPATEDAVRVDESTVDLPKIPVQPIGYGAAAQILSKMRGREVPDASWKGGLELPYRLEGGADLRVRMKVEQKRTVRRSANVIATLKGTRQDGSSVIVGCHHDAWGFGAADPLAGTIVLMECAKAFSKCAAAGVRPDCDILFCAWGAEEFGIIGSTEWVEARRDKLGGVRGYLNLDMASMGPNLGASASPSLQAVVAAASGLGREKVGAIGAGSDHIGFIFHAGVPSVGVSASGAPGTAYHSNYDTTAWYRKTVGEDYASASIVARATLAIMAALSQLPVTPVSASDMIDDVRKACAAIEGTSAPSDDSVQAAKQDAARRVAECFAKCVAAASAFDRDIAAANAVGGVTEVTPALDRRARAIDRALLDMDGIPGRPWYRNLALASDRDSGYAATALPALAEAATPQAASLAADRLCASAERFLEFLTPRAAIKP
ncbi:MAG: M28 family peptidase [Phycisphaerales bacterium]|nr:M28 family peptidase [Phycisphaerales bacterium]